MILCLMNHSSNIGRLLTFLTISFTFLWKPLKTCFKFIVFKYRYKTLLFNVIFLGFFFYWKSTMSIGLKIHWLHSLQKSKTPSHHKKECTGYDTKLHLMIRFHFCKSRECRVPLYYYYSKFHFDPVVVSLESHLYVKKICLKIIHIQ